MSAEYCSTPIFADHPSTAAAWYPEALSTSRVCRLAFELLMCVVLILASRYWGSPCSHKAKDEQSVTFHVSER